MPENKLHNALFGYKKQEVHAYIAEISENAEKEALKYQEAAEEFKAELAAVKKRQISQQNTDAGDERDGRVHASDGIAQVLPDP